MAQIDRLFDMLLERKGSDLHLGVGYPPLGRIHGALTPLMDASLTVAQMEALLFEILDPVQKKQITEELDLDFAYALGAKARFRANYFYKKTGLGAVFRTIPTKILSLDELGAPEIVRKLADRDPG